MAVDIPLACQPVLEAIRQFGLSSKIVVLAESTRTAKEAAQTIGCEVAEIAKSIVFRGQTTQKPVLVVACGANRIKEELIAAIVGEPIEKADADYVRQRTGFAIGGVPPLGHAEPVTTIIDKDLLQFDAIWAAAGTPHAVFCLTPQELVRCASSEPRVVS